MSTLPEGVQIVLLDTETTGFSPEFDRVIELGCFKLEGRKIVDVPQNSFHELINPERDIPAQSTEVHGITDADVADKPPMREIIPAFLDFVRGTHLVIHNAPFDMGMLNAELVRNGYDTLDTYVHGVTDTLAMARARFPGHQANLDNVCRLLDIPLDSRADRHGALIDAMLLARAYLAMTLEQTGLELDVENLEDLTPLPDASLLRVVCATPEEEAAHLVYLDKVVSKKAKAKAKWLEAIQPLDDATSKESA